MVKLSYNELKKWVDITLSAHELADTLSLSGFEVEGVTPLGQDLSNIITGKITKIEKHPNADKLQITQVFDGQTTHQIVTGAQNIFEGAIVPASLPGAVLANGTKIKHGNLRGVDSNGMLCSQVELGLADVSEGIWILPENTPLGVDFVAYAQLRDVILDVAVLPNRKDCQTLPGLAREIGALLNKPLLQTLPPEGCEKAPYCIPWDSKKINQILGTDYPEQAMLDILLRLGLTLNAQGGLEIPPHRRGDLEEVPCIAEEISRFMGLDTIPTCLPDHMVIVDSPSKEATLIQKTQRALIERGFSQLVTFPMVSKEDFEKTGVPMTDLTVTIQNPLTPEESIMRHQMLPSLLKVAQFNANRSEKTCRIFEAGNIYASLENQALELGVLWAMSTETIFHLKGLALSVLESLGYQDVQIQAMQSDQLHPTQSGLMRIHETVVGHFGFLHPKLIKAYDLEGALGYITLNLSQLSKIEPPITVFKAIPKFPSVRRDVSLLVPKSLTYAEILAAIHAQKPKRLKEIFLFDCYESEALGPDKKSLALGVIYQDADKTLTTEEIDTMHNGLWTRLQATLPITLR